MVVSSRAVLACTIPALLACAGGGNRRQAPDAPAAATLRRSEIAERITASLAAAGRDPCPPPAERHDLEELYGSDSAPRWIDAAGRPTLAARDALSLLQSAGAEGLDPSDYDAAGLASQARTLGADSSPRDLADFDVGLSRSTLRYLRHLHSGRVNPRAIGFRMAAPADDHDYAALVDAALAEGALRRTAADLAPPFVQYRCAPAHAHPLS